jgi:hypothetical protein
MSGETLSTNAQSILDHQYVFSKSAVSLAPLTYTDQEVKALDRHIKVDDLELLAQKIWEDSLDWSTLSQLVNAQRKTIKIAKEYLELTASAALVNAPIDKEMARLQKVLTELSEIGTTISQDFCRRGQSISDLVRPAMPSLSRTF